MLEPVAHGFEVARSEAKRIAAVTKPAARKPVIAGLFRDEAAAERIRRQVANGHLDEPAVVGKGRLRDLAVPKIGFEHRAITRRGAQRIPDHAGGPYVRLDREPGAPLLRGFLDLTQGP